MKLSYVRVRCQQKKAIYTDHRSPPWLTEDVPRDRSSRWLCARALRICDYLIDYRYRVLESSASLRSICLYGLDALSRIPRKVYYMTRRSDPHRWINAEVR
jgi:hypothetical protein